MPAATTDRVRFVLDGNIVELRDIDPTRTVLQYLREDLHRTGSKEGCAEGDCGACTVVLVELTDGGQLRSRAVNACIQFLPTLDGKELLTVESLRNADGSLHPVQQAMVDCHGSQCGFCTPGFVMSMFALYKNAAAPTRVEIDDALAGNLCRCTGYRPIVDAARDMYERAPGGSATWLQSPAGNRGSDEQQRIDRLVSIQHEQTLALQHHGRKFFAPRTAAELATLRADHPEATLLAGGTDVGLWVTKELREFDSVIYTGRVKELLEITEQDGCLTIGAAVPLTDVMPRITAYYPELDELLRRFASPPIRNAGTLGGNVANGSPIGDTMPALLALNTRLTLNGNDGPRELPLDEFYLDYMKNALRPGEFLQQMHIPLPADGLHFRAYKISKRFDQDISAVCVAIAMELAADGAVNAARVGCGGLAAVPKRAAHCEEALTGKVFDEALIDTAMRAMDEDFSAISDMRASDEYRERVARNLLLRFYRDVTAVRDGHSQPGIYAYGRG